MIILIGKQGCSKRPEKSPILRGFSLLCPSFEPKLRVFSVLLEAERTSSILGSFGQLSRALVSSPDP